MHPGHSWILLQIRIFSRRFHRVEDNLQFRRHRESHQRRFRSSDPRPQWPAPPSRSLFMNSKHFFHVHCCSLASPSRVRKFPGVHAKLPASRGDFMSRSLPAPSAASAHCLFVPALVSLFCRHSCAHSKSLRNFSTDLHLAARSARIAADASPRSPASPGNTKTYYMGTPGGGVWKTTERGHNVVSHF